MHKKSKNLCTLPKYAQKIENFVHVVVICTKNSIFAVLIIETESDMNSLPYSIDFDDVKILKALNKANHKLGQLNGAINLLPNPYVIFNAITLGEAKESSEIENIVTTFDELFKEMSYSKTNPASKEVLNYRRAMLHGFELIKKNGFLSANHIIEIHRIVEPSAGDIRRLPGTVIKNTKTGEVMHTPPQDYDEIMRYLSNLEQYINADDLEDTDAILKMAAIHFQFESIHPFYDGNGRTGRIINILYLTLSKKLDIPILYLSKYINRNRTKYYQLLNETQQDLSKIKNFLLFMIEGVSEMSDFTLNFINSFVDTMHTAAEVIKERCGKTYSPMLLEHLFYDFYTKNEYLCHKMDISRNTAGKYLRDLAQAGILIEEKIGKTKLYKNTFLYNLIKTW